MKLTDTQRIVLKRVRDVAAREHVYRRPQLNTEVIGSLLELGLIKRVDDDDGLDVTVAGYDWLEENQI